MSKNAIALEKKLKHSFWIKYTIFFVIMLMARYAPLWIRGLTTIRNNDAMNQYMYTLMYLGEWLRGGIEGSLPMWDLSIGFGQDVLTTLHYYGFTDPLSFFSVLFDSEHMWILYEGIQITKLYLAGVTFATFCFYHNKKENAVLLGALIYVFSGWTTVLGIQFIQFLTPLVYLPIVLLGVDKVYREKKCSLFIGMLALAGITNFYFFYMICFFAFIYIIVSYCFIVKDWTIKSIVKWFFYFLGTSLVAVLLASVVLLPVLGVFLQSERISSGYVVPGLFPLIHYIHLPVTILSFDGAYGMVPIVLFALYFLVRNKERKCQMVLFAFFALMLCVPWLQKAVNGFAYATERWGFAWTLFAAFVCVDSYDDVLEITKRERYILLIFMGAFLLLKVIVFREIDVSFFGCIAVTAIICLMYFRKVTVQHRGQMVLWISIITSIGCSWEVFSNKTHPMGYQNYVSFDEIAKAHMKTPIGIMSEDIEREENMRVGTSYSCSYLEGNAALALGFYGTSHAFSLTTDVMANFYNMLYLNSYNDFNYNGFENKAVLDSLFAVKYVLSEGNEQYPAYYQLVKDYQNGYYLYYNDAALPLAYTYDKAISVSEWLNMSPEDRQSAMLQAAVVESSTLPYVEFTSDNIKKTFSVAEQNGVTFNDGEIQVHKKDGSVLLDFEGYGKCETYLKMSGLHYEGKNEYAEISLRSSDDECEISVLPRSYYLSSGKEDYLCNLGYQIDSRQKIEIVFHTPGTYYYKELGVVEQNVEDIPVSAKILAQDTLQNFEIDSNSISGVLSIDKTKILCVSVPYSKGWTCYANGEEIEVIKVNQSCIGVELAAGRYLIEFRYVTPLLPIGSLLSFVGLIVYVGLVIYEKRQRVQIIAK